MKWERTLKRFGRGLAKINPRTAISLSCIVASRQFDLMDPAILVYIRLANFTSVLFTLMLLAFIAYKIVNNPDGQRELTVKESDLVPPNPFAEQPESEEVRKISVQKYDLVKLRARFTELATQVAVVTGIHAYSGFVVPLLIQAFTSSLSTIDSELFKIHVRGRDPKIYRDLKRPWSGTENSMLKMFQTSYKQANNMMETIEGKAPDKSNKDRKGKKGKKQR